MRTATSPVDEDQKLYVLHRDQLIHRVGEQVSSPIPCRPLCHRALEVPMGRRGCQENRS